MAKKILLADDSLTIQKVVELTFSDGDFDLVCVSNGQKALDKVRDDRPDLILADVVMPEKNGYEVCEAIKGNPATARIPVVLLSGTFEPFDRDRAERIGCDAIVSKPFDSQQLISQVEALLGRSRSEAPEPEAVAPASPATSTEHDRAPFDAGFSSEDFTASIRVSPPTEPFDPFEEEYGARGDVDSAILAFEKAHPQFSSSPGAAADTGEAEDVSDLGKEPGGPEGPGEAEFTGTEWSRRSGTDAFKPESASAPPWLIDESEASAPAAHAPGGSRAGIWGWSDEEPTSPLEFDPERTNSLRSGRRADEGPTQEIPPQPFSTSERLYPSEPARMPREQSAGGPAEADAPAWGAVEPREISAEDAEVLFDVAPSEEDELDAEGSREDDLDRARSEEKEDVDAAAEQPMEEGEGFADEAPPPAAGAGTGGSDGGPSPPVASAPAEAPAVSPELEALAQTASIPELTTMLSAVMRSGSELSDAEIDRLARRVVEMLTDKIVREIAWEVIPDMAEIVIKERIKELESGAE